MTSKFCLRCKQTKALEEFSTDTRTKDGRQKWCKVCWIDYHDNVKRKKKVAAKIKSDLKEVPKLTALIEKTSEMGGDMIGAYQAIHGNINRNTASDCLNLYLDKVANNETLSEAAKKVTQSPLFKSFVDRYLQLCYNSDNPQYMRDAILTMGKLAGDLVDKREVTTRNQEEATQAFESKMESVLSRMESKN